MIVYLNKVDFSPSQSFFSKKKKGHCGRESQNKTHAYGKLNLTDTKGPTIKLINDD